MGIKDFIYTIVQQAVREVITKEVNVRIDGLSQRIDDVEKSLSQRIDSVEKRLDQRISDVEKNLTEKFDVRFNTIEKELANIRGNLEGEARLFHIMDMWKRQQSL